MSWPTWLSIWKKEGLPVEGMVLRPSAPGSRVLPAFANITHAVPLFHSRINTRETPHNPRQISRAGIFSSFTTQDWDEDLLTVNGATFNPPDWTKILPCLEEGTYEPTPEIDSPALHAPIPENNLPYRPGMYISLHPQPVVHPRFNMPCSKAQTHTEAAPGDIRRERLTSSPQKTILGTGKVVPSEEKCAKAPNSRTAETSPRSGCNRATPENRRTTGQGPNHLAMDPGFPRKAAKSTLSSELRRTQSTPPRNFTIHADSDGVANGDVCYG